MLLKSLKLNLSVPFFLEENELLNNLEENFDTFHKFVQEISVFSFLKFFNFFLQRPRYVFL